MVRVGGTGCNEVALRLLVTAKACEQRATAYNCIQGAVN